jgi:hypothetical protein
MRGRRVARRPIWIGQWRTDSPPPGAGRLAGWAGSSPGLARPSQIPACASIFFFFLFLIIQIMKWCYALNLFENVLSLRKL